MMIRKFFSVMFVITLSIGLTACSNSPSNQSTNTTSTNTTNNATPSSDNTTKQQTNSSQATKKKKTENNAQTSQKTDVQNASDFIEAMKKAQHHINSLSASISIESFKKTQAGDVVNHLKTSIKQTATKNPEASHTVFNTDRKGRSMTIEMYETPKGSYIKNNRRNIWMKVNQLPIGNVSVPVGKDNVHKQITHLKKMAQNSNYVSVKTKDNTYVFHYEGSGEDLKEFGLFIYKQGKMINQTVAYQHMAYTYVLGQQHGYPIKMTWSAKGTMEGMTQKDQGQVFNIKTSMTMTLSDINQVQPITVPKQVQQQAESIRQ